MSTTVNTYEDLKPAQRVTALLALRDALDAEIREQKEHALSIAEQVGVKSFDTEFGTLTVVQKDAGILINQVALLAWAKETDPDYVETIEQVKPWAAKTITDHLAIVDGSVYESRLLAKTSVADGIVFTAAGEVVAPVPFASVGNVPDPYVAWPSSPKQKAAKAYAHEFIADNATKLAGSLLEITR